MRIKSKILYYILLSYVIVGCSNMENKNEIYEVKGIPIADQSFSYMYFKNEKEGYLFGEYKKYLNIEEVIKNPKIRSEIEFERNIYKTVDGGHNWEKIEKFFNGQQIVYADADNVIVKNGNIYVSTINLSNDDRFIDIFSIEENKVIKRKKSEFEFFVLLQGDKKEIYSLASEKYGSDAKIITYDSDLTILDSMNMNWATFLKGIIVNNTTYIINSDNDKGNLHFSTIDEKGIIKEISLSIYPNSMIQKSPTNILLVGRDKLDDNKIKFVNYDTNTGENRVIKEVDGYSIIDQLQFNDKIIIAFIGNVKGGLIEYDLIYSQDKGKTWTIKELEENKAVKPSYLINNILYIYSSTHKIQKIIFDR